MSVVVTVREETTSGSRSEGVELSFPTERLTVREIIRAWVYEGTQDRAARERQACGSGCATAGARAPHASWQEGFARACEEYGRGRVLVLAGDRQTESLDEVVELSRGIELTFLRLVPLVGG